MLEVESERMYDPIEGMNPKQKLIYNETNNWLKNLPFSTLDLVEDFDFVMMGRKTIICTAVLKNGYEVTAYSSPVNIQEFNAELGKALAKKHVLEQIMSLDRYHKMAVATTMNGVNVESNIIHGHSYETITEGEK